MTVRYPSGQNPQFWRPSPPSATHRFALGTPADPTAAVSENPLVVMGMNPSHANETISDATVNRVIRASQYLGYSSWIMLNLYPERNSSPTGLNTFDAALSQQNCTEIRDVLQLTGTSEILGAWGDLRHPALRQAKADVLSLLRSLGVRVYYYGTATHLGNPRHPNQRGAQWDLTGPKKYL